MAGPTHKPVGAGLPAMTSTRATLKVTDPMLSLASQLPQGRVLDSDL